MGESDDEYQDALENFSEIVRAHLKRHAIKSIRQSMKDSVMSDDELVTKFSQTMLEQLTIRLSIFKDEEGLMRTSGYPSQLFVASGEAAKNWNHPFSVDGPWKLTQDRLRLHLEPQNAIEYKLQSRNWNSKLSSLIDIAYAWVMNLIIEKDCLSFSLEDMRKLLHHFPTLTKNIHRPIQIGFFDYEIFRKIMSKDSCKGTLMLLTKLFHYGPNLLIQRTKRR